jgi:tryptophan-rich sensory protein
MKIINQRILFFLTLNFLALFLGGLATTDGVASVWYDDLLKAPWTPPGWVFGFAWTLIMVCFAFYMAIALERVKHVKPLLALYVAQWFLNVLWNPVFFHYQEVFAGLILILTLTHLVTFILFSYLKTMKKTTLLIVPYFIWLLIASSLNLYIYWYN